MISSLLAQTTTTAASQAAVDYTMQPAGWVFMLGSITLVICLAGYCYYKVLSKPASANHMHAPLDIDTHDKNT